MLTVLNKIPRLIGLLFLTLLNIGQEGPSPIVPGSTSIHRLDSEALPEIDLHLAVDTDPWVGLLGEELKFIVRIDNKGPEDTPSATLSLDFPPQLQMTDINGVAEDCNYVDGVYLCALGPVNVGQSRLVDISTTVLGEGTVTSTLKLSTLEAYDQHLDNNSQEHQSVLLLSGDEILADLQLSSSASPNPAPTEWPVSLRFTTENLGPGLSEDVHLYVDFPPFSGSVSGEALEGPCTLEDLNLDCALGNLQAGEIQTTTVFLSSEVPQNLDIRAQSFTYASPDPYSPNNYGGIELSIQDDSDLQVDGSLSLTSESAELLTLETATVEIRVSNEGPETIQEGSVQLQLSDSLLMLSAYLGEQRCVISEALECPIPTLQSQGQLLGQLVVQGKKASTTAQVNGLLELSHTDNNPDNNQATWTTQVSAVIGEEKLADLSVEIVADQATLGLPTTVQVTGFNEGPDEATNTTLNLRFDQSWALENIHSGDYLCRSFEGLVSCEVGNLGAKDSASFSLELTASQGNEGSIAGEVFCDVTELDPFDNTQNIVLNIEPPSDNLDICNLELEFEEAELSPKQSSIYALVLRAEHGQGLASEQTKLSYNPPESLEVLAVYTSQGSCSSDRPIECSLNTLMHNRSASAQILLVPQSIEPMEHTATLISPCSSTNGNSQVAELQQTTQGSSTILADLQLSLQTTATTSMAGETLRGTFLILNDSSSDLSNVKLAGAVQGNANILWSSSEGNGQCEDYQNRFYCSEIELAAGAETWLTMEIQSGAAGPITLSATTWQESITELHLEDNSATAQIDIQGEGGTVDLVTSLQGTPQTGLVGEKLYLRMEVANLGYLTASDVHLVGSYDNALHWLSTPEVQENCTLERGSIQCRVTSLAPQSVSSWLLEFEPTYPGNLSVSLTATSSEIEFAPSDNSSESTFIVVEDGNNQGESDIGALISVPEGLNPFVGDTFSLSIGAENLGKGTAENVQVTLPIPPQFTFEAADAPCKHTGSTLLCELGDIDEGSMNSLRASLTINQAGNLSLGVIASAGPYDINPSNNTAELTLAVSPAAGEKAADLSLETSLSPQPGNIGAPVIWKSTVTNKGPDPASQVNLEVHHSESAEVYEISAPGATCQQKQGYLQCGWADLEPESVSRLSLTLIPTQIGDLISSSYLWSEQFDPNEANNQESQAVNILSADATDRQSDLALEVWTEPESGVVGDELSYQIQVQNNGPDIASQVIVENTLGSPLSYVGASLENGLCALNIGVLTCELGVIDVNQSQLLSVTIIPTGETSLFYEASVSASEMDGKTSDNTAQLTTLIEERQQASASIQSNPLEARSASPGDKEVPILAASLSAGSSESVQVTRAHLKASGTGADNSQISAIHIFQDQNNNQQIDATDLKVASGTFGADDGTLILPLDKEFIVGAGQVQGLIIAYDIDPEAQPKDATVARPMNIDARGACALAAITALLSLLIYGHRAPRTVFIALVLSSCNADFGGIAPATNSVNFKVELLNLDIVGTNFANEATVSGLPISGSELTVTFEDW